MGLDARVRYTKMVIKDALVSLLKEKPLNKVTVKEVCELAQINRATFYRYYSNPFDLMDQIEAEFLRSLWRGLEVPKRSFREGFVFIMENIQADSERYLTLFSENGDSKFPSRIFSLYYERSSEELGRRFPDLSPVQREWLYSFAAQGCCGILERWIQNGMKENIGDVADFAEKLIGDTRNNVV